MKYMISLKEFGPIISNKIIGEKIYQMIMEKDPRTNVVEIDLEGVKSMATFCAKQIFGQLYTGLTPEVFGKNIVIKNASPDVRPVINIGIRYAIENLDFSLLK